VATLFRGSVAKNDKNKPETLEQAYGRVIILHREKLGLSQKDVAAATGYSLRYVGDVERGKKSATLRTMNDFATLFNIHVGSLIAEAEALLSDKEKSAKTHSPAKGRSSTRRA
jgi:transcriptional regulator with XRE-family HTH domain